MTPSQDNQNNVVALFQFIEELNKLKQKNIIDARKHLWYFPLANLHEDPENITVNYRDRVESDDETFSGLLLSVHKPEFQRCPAPDAIFSDWLEKGWDNFELTVAVKETLPEEPQPDPLFAGQSIPNDPNREKPELFTDSAARVNAYQSWLVKRNEWAEKQKTIKATRDLFSDLYALYFELQKEAETEEIIVANGLLFDRDNPEVRHPVLTHRVKLNYNPDTNTVSIEDSDIQSELYTIVFQLLPGINLTSINKLNEDLLARDYHPLDRNETPDFLKVLVRQLTSDSLYSEDPAPDEWQGRERLMMCFDPCYIVRKRLDGTLKAIQQIVENIQDTGEVPPPILDIVSGGMMEIPEDTGVRTLEEQLASVGGESSEILLSKEANKEQLEIAQRIEKYNAVLVQGPPGTGKTHTIANLMGHFIAQGKSVLVTSYTTKALSVLKEKVAPGLQSLCVSLLDDSNVDMEKSVDGITDYMSKYTSFDLKREMGKLAVQRKDIMDQLAEVRRKIFAIIQQESAAIVLNGEDISPSKAAAFICEHTEDLSYIPGPVKAYAPLPLTTEELIALYKSNGEIEKEDEKELSYNIPDPSQVMTPDKHREAWEKFHNAKDRINAIREEKGWSIDCDDTTFHIDGNFGSFTAKYSTVGSLQRLKEYADTIENIDPWMQSAAVDGKNGGAYRQRWEMLMEQIRATNEYAESILTERFGHMIEFKTEDYDSLKIPFEKIRGFLAAKGKISSLNKMMNKDIEPALAAVSVDGHPAGTAEECDMILHTIELQSLKNKCAMYWNQLLASETIPVFYELDSKEPERIAANWLPLITRYLDWYQNDFVQLSNLIQSNGLTADIIFSKNILDSDLVATGKILDAAKNALTYICDVELAAIETREIKDQFAEAREKLTQDGCDRSIHCRSLIQALYDDDADKYATAYQNLYTLYQKYDLQHVRGELLSKLEPYAPNWAAAIRTRNGIHGEQTLPATIDDAWKWIQLSQIISGLTAKPFADLQAESIQLSKAYRSVTAQYAEKSGWYHLLSRTEANIDMKQALQGWKLTVKRIGKGTGKSAPALKAEARKLMTKCQDAVPGWIMPINKALESLNPKSNRYDIIIIDEASQADISSLAILYMGRKLIIVGDDKQVSPMAVGVELDKMTSLEQMYLRGRIPNAHLYNAKTSIYDIAATTFQPLMLREHFRCVPEIIGFSNNLSYDGKIKPLRDASDSKLLPAVVNYRVANGERQGKENYNEAKAIVALMQACMEQPEYAKKSFGVISLLGDEQVRVIQQLIEKELDPKDIIQRNILCGNSANFQGDERDVVFLSLVDSGKEFGPLRMVNFGADDSIRKRYNVATSRARDQLWVVDSLDPANDLQPGDLRKRLIDYSINPQSFQQREIEIDQASESPFEASVAKALTNLGYHLEQQRQVGAYRLDIVAVCGEKEVAIECDGERWHSGEAKIREDMERQTILERTGWRFIRIRGSEYYRDPKATIDDVVKKLNNLDIKPESAQPVTESGRETELLKRVKLRAYDLLEQRKEDNKAEAQKVVEYALGHFDQYADAYTRQKNAGKASQFNKAAATAPKANTPAAAPRASTPAPVSRKEEKNVDQPAPSAGLHRVPNQAAKPSTVTSQKPATSEQRREAEPAAPAHSTSWATDYRFVTITWDIGGNKLQRQVRRGSTPYPPATDKKPDANAHYTFRYWNKPVKTAMQDTTYTAVFSQELHHWGKEIVIDEPTRSTKGKKICTCTVCGYTRPFDIPELKDELKDDWVFENFSWFGKAQNNNIYALATFRRASNSKKTSTFKIIAEKIKSRTIDELKIEETYKVAIAAENSPDGLSHSEQKVYSYVKPGYYKQNTKKEAPPPVKITEPAFKEYMLKSGLGKEKADTLAYRRRIAHYYAQENIAPNLSLDVDDLDLINETIDALLDDAHFLRDNEARKESYIEALKLFGDFAKDTLTPATSSNQSTQERHLPQEPNPVKTSIEPPATTQTTSASRKVDEGAFKRYLIDSNYDIKRADIYNQRRRQAHFYAQAHIDPNLSLFTDDLELINRTIDALLSSTEFKANNGAAYALYVEALNVFRLFANSTLSADESQTDNEIYDNDASEEEPSRRLTNEEFTNIITTMKTGGRSFRRNLRIATILETQAYLGIALSDVLRLKLSDFTYYRGHYQLNLRLMNSEKERAVFVSEYVYRLIKEFATKNRIPDDELLFPISKTAVEKHLKAVCDYLGYKNVTTRCFRYWSNPDN